MANKIAAVVIVLAFGAALESGCATKKYVRNRIDERVQPLENRTAELEETSRRNSEQIGTLNTALDDAKSRADRAQQTADRAASTAEAANTRVAAVESNVEDIKANLDQYSVEATAIVFFRPGSARLTSEARAQLDQLADQVNGRTGFVLEITGFGDTSRATRLNQNLAQLRAEEVERYFADKHDLPVMRMFALGFGAARPSTEKVSTSAEPPGTSEFAARRRVEIKVLVNKAAISPKRQATTQSR